MENSNIKYQTVLYEAESYDETYGWEFGKKVIFQSAEYPDISQAMKEFNELALPDRKWFAYTRVIENGNIVEEEMFDSSAISEA